MRAIITTTANIGLFSGLRGLTEVTGFPKWGIHVWVLLLALFMITPRPLPALTLENSSDGALLGQSLSLLRDESQRLGIDEVRHAANTGLFNPINGKAEPNFSYTHAALWFHTPLINGTSETSWLLELAFPQIDEVDLYLIDRTSGAIVNHFASGDTRPFSERPVAHRNFAFPVTLAPQGNYDLFMRIRSEGTLTVPLHIWKSSTFSYASRNAYMVMMLYLGLLLAFFAYNLRLYFSLRHRLYLYYLGYIASFALAMGAWNGLFFEYLWPNSPQWGNIASVIGYNLTGMFGAIFSRKFLDSRTFTPLLDRIMNLCAWVFALLVISVPLGYFQQISMLTSANGILFAVTAVISAIYCLRAGQRSARYFLLAWSLLLFGTAIMGARSFGLMPSNYFTRYAMQFGSVIDILLLSLALTERIGDLRRDKERAEEEALFIRRTMVELLEQTELDLEQRVAERTEELTQLNQRLQEQEQYLKGLAMYDALTGLANRTLLDERLVEALAHAQQRGYKVALMLIDLDDFKPINDTHGHAVGDAVLQDIAARLKKLVRSTDTVARLGGDEFVILMHGLSDADRAAEIGQSVIEELSQPSVIAGHTLTVTASVGIAFYPDHGLDGPGLLRQADKAMYEAKRNGRNRLMLSTGTA